MAGVFSLVTEPISVAEYGSLHLVVGYFEFSHA